jgi:hypothetical protein
MKKVIGLTESDLMRLVKKVINEQSEIQESHSVTLEGGTIKGTGDEWPDVNVEFESDGYIKLSQKIDRKTSMVILSKKQFAKLIKEE